MRNRLRLPTRGTLAACASSLALSAAACGGDPAPASPSDTSPSVDATASADVDSDASPAADTAADTSSPAADTASPDDAASPADTTPPSEDVVVPENPILARGDRCDSLETLAASALPLTDAVTTTAEFTDRYIYSLGPACGGNAGGAEWGDASPDVVYAFTPHLDGFYNIKATPGGAFDLGLMVTAACPPRNADEIEAAGCLGAVDDGRAGVAEQLGVALEAGFTTYILVDGFDNEVAHAGAFTLEIALGEDCEDGVDNDGNDDVDCADSQCAAAPSCDESNVATYGADACGDSEDNDGDGLTDCRDDDCARASACQETLCDDGLDNNQNGETDCEDAGCDASPACRAEGEGCARSVTLEPGVAQTFDTCVATNTASRASSASGCSSWSSNNAAPDRWFTFTATVDAPYRVTLNEDDWDAVINVVAGACPTGPVAACVAGRDGPEGSGVTFQATAGTTYRVIVDGWSDETDCGPASIELAQLAPEACDDGVDNDQNGRIDCRDSACFGVGTCPLAPIGDDCRVPLAITSGTFSQTFDTCEYTNTFVTASSVGTCQKMGTGGDLVASFTAPADGRFKVSFDTGSAGSGGTGYFDATLTIVKSDTCPTAAPTGCLAGTDIDPEKLYINATAGETFQIFADAYGSGCGNATLSVTQLVPEVCNDNVDNDENGQKDCADTACAASATCNERATAGGCSDGVSTDNDALVDCSDPDCIADAAACPNGLLGDSCLAPTAMTEGGAALTLDLCNYTDRYVAVTDLSAGCKVGSTDAGTKDAVVAFTPSTSGTFAARASVTSGNVLLHQTTLTACTPQGATRHLIPACVASKNDVSFGTTAERIDFDGVAGEPVYFILESASTTCGSVTFEVVPVAPEVCTGGVDEDIDGAVDCYDSSCFGRDGCPNGLPNDTCATAEVVDGAGWSARVNTCSFTNDFQGSGSFTSGCESHGSAGDAVVRVVAAEAGTYRVTLDAGAAGSSGGGSFDSVINVVKATACPGAGSASGTTGLTACVASVDDGDPETLDFEAAAGEEFWVFFDGYSTGCGPAALSITRLAPEACGDGVDNDGDGGTDCADLDDCNGADRPDPLADCPQLDLTCGTDVVIASLPYSDPGRDMCDYLRAVDFDADSCESNIESEGGGVTYSYTAPVAQTVTVIATPTAADIVLNLSTFCNPAGLTTCVAGSDRLATEEASASLEAGETLYIHVNLYNASYSGDVCEPFSLSVQAE